MNINTKKMDFTSVAPTFTAAVIDRLQQAAAEQGAPIPDQVQLGLDEARASLASSPRDSQISVLTSWGHIAACSAATGPAGQGLTDILIQAARGMKEPLLACFRDLEREAAGEPVPALLQDSLARMKQPGDPACRLVMAPGVGLAAGVTPNLLAFDPDSVVLFEPPSRRAGEWLVAHGFPSHEADWDPKSLLDFVMAHELAHVDHQDMVERMGVSLGEALLQASLTCHPDEPQASVLRTALDGLAVAEIDRSWSAEFRADREAVERMRRCGYDSAVAALAGVHLTEIGKVLNSAPMAELTRLTAGVPTHPPEAARTRALQGDPIPDRFATLEPLCLDGSWTQVSDNLAQTTKEFGDGPPWTFNRQRVHAQWEDGRVMSLPGVSVWGERTVVEDGETVRERLRLEGADQILERETGAQRHVYRNGLIQSTREETVGSDGTKTVVDRKYSHEEVVEERRTTEGIPASDGGPAWKEEWVNGVSSQRSRHVGSGGERYSETAYASGDRLLSRLEALPERYPFEDPLPVEIPGGKGNILLSGAKSPEETARLLELLGGHLTHQQNQQKVCLVDSIQDFYHDARVSTGNFSLARDLRSGILYVDRRELLADRPNFALTGLVGVDPSALENLPGRRKLKLV